jgi:hypothetical protein
MPNRKAIIEQLANELPKHDVVRAAWLAGSDATGRTDDMSDVDLMVVADTGGVENALACVLAIVSELSPIAIEYRLPAPTWHGAEQTFLRLEGAPDWLMIDAVVLEKGKPHPWLEVERHGEAHVLFDKDGLVKRAHVDRAAIGRTIRENVERLRKRFALFHHLPEKLVRRDLPVDAAHFYHALVLKPFVDLLRAVHCPDRHDYGFRYVKNDLPKAEYELVCRLAYPRPDQIVAFVGEVKSLFATYASKTGI